MEQIKPYDIGGIVRPVTANTSCADLLDGIPFSEMTVMEKRFVIKEMTESFILNCVIFNRDFNTWIGEIDESFCSFMASFGMIYQRNFAVDHLTKRLEYMGVIFKDVYDHKYKEYNIYAVGVAINQSFIKETKARVK